MRNRFFIAKGFTLTELMIAMFLGSTLLLISAQILIHAGKTNRIAHQQGIMQENAVLAKYFLETDIRRSGYYGGLQQGDDISGTEKVQSFKKKCEGGDEKFAMMIFPSVFALNNTGSSYACLENYVTDSDVLVLRYLLPTKQVETESSKRHKLYMRVNSMGALLFKAMNKDHYSNKFSDGVGDLFEVKTYIYYLRNTKRVCDGEIITGLYREYNNNKGYMEAEEIVSGIEQMQFRFLVNDQLKNADQVLDEEWQAIDAISVSMLLRAECSEHLLVNKKSFQLQDFEFVPASSVSILRQTFHFDITLRN